MSPNIIWYDKGRVSETSLCTLLFHFIIFMYTYGHSLENTALSNLSFVMSLIDIDMQKQNK